MHKAHSTLTIFSYPRIFLESILLILFLGPLFLCGVQFSSWIMQYVLGALMMIVTKPKRVIKKNLKLCFPDKSEDELYVLSKKIIHNLGRILGEMPHIQYLGKNQKKHITFTNFDNFEKLRNNKNASIMVTGHFSNWELLNVWIQQSFSEKRYAFTYRSLNNPFADYLLKKIRVITDKSTLLPRGMEGTNKLVKCIKKGMIIGTTADQFIREGSDAKLMNIVTKTTNTPGKLAIKYDIPICIAFIRRTKNTSFNIEFCDHIKHDKNLGKEENIKIITQKINDAFTQEITENPEEWFWPHRRFR